MGKGEAASGAVQVRCLRGEVAEEIDHQAELSSAARHEVLDDLREKGRWHMRQRSAGG